MIVEVLLPLAVDHPFSYIAAYDLGIGQLVMVPFRNTKMVGVVIATADQHPGRALKSIIEVLPVRLQQGLLEFIRRMASYNLSPIGMVFKMCLAGNKHWSPIEPMSPGVLRDSLTQLNPEQMHAASALLALESGVMVLEGVTGSGKTEVYSHLIEHMLRQGRQVLLLMPEILLATHITKRLSGRFGPSTIEWHSHLTPKTRSRNYQRVMCKGGLLLIAARSGLMLPFADLGAIIVDEEHDGSYKQDDVVIYHARDMAVLRGSIQGCRVVLASATPSIETIHNVQTSKYHHIHLSHRFGHAVLPKINVIDMKKEKMDKNCFLSPTLLSSLRESLREGNQALLYLNRRGYAPMTICKACGHRVECPCCSALMVEHRHKKLLQCHYCGHTMPSTTTCSNCGTVGKITTYGPGVERIAEELQQLVPEAKVSIFTSDYISTRKQAEQMIAQIENKEINVIVGTQMIAKGLHFPALQMVGIIDADAGMIGGYIRAIEHTYQLLLQVSGRAGRDRQQGLVLLQTNEPQNTIIGHLLAHDSKQFIAQELEDRRISNSPPFSRLVLVGLSAFDEGHLMMAVNQLARLAPQVRGMKIIGPASAPIYMIGKRYRYRFVVKSDKRIGVQTEIKSWLRSAALPSSIKVRVDVDPYNFL